MLARLFRGKMLTMLMDAYDAGELRFFNTHAGLAGQENIQVPHRVQRMAMLTTITSLPMSESRALWHHSAGCDGESSRSRFDRLYRIKALHGPAIETSVSITIPLARILAE